jgi:hypothetical protein
MPVFTHGTSDALSKRMNAALQARVRHLVTREFDRRGRLTWDMKLALKHAVAGLSSRFTAPPGFDRDAGVSHSSNSSQGGPSK